MYNLGNETLESFTIHVSVWTKSVFGGKECLGMTEYQLNFMEVSNGITKWYDLKKQSDSNVYPIWSSTHPITSGN